jgi:hypothetical protein
VYNRDSCTWFTAALFMVGTWHNQPRDMATKEWLQEMWYIYILSGSFSAVKNKDVIFRKMDQWKIVIEPVRKTNIV